MDYEVKVANYGQERELNCTPEELEISERVLAEFPDERLRLVCVSNDYATVKRGSWDIVRLKYTKRAKWLMFPTLEAKKVKHYIERPDEVDDYMALIKDSIDHAKKWK